MAISLPRGTNAAKKPENQRSLASSTAAIPADRIVVAAEADHVMNATVRRLAAYIWQRHRRALETRQRGLVVVAIHAPSDTFTKETGIYPAELRFISQSRVAPFLNSIGLATEAEALSTQIATLPDARVVVLVITDIMHAVFHLVGGETGPAVIL